MSLLTDVITSFQSSFSGGSSLTINHILTCAALFTRLPRHEIQNGSQSTMTSNTAAFLQSSLHLTLPEVQWLFDLCCLGATVPTDDTVQDLYEKHGTPVNRSFQDIRPARQICKEQKCQAKGKAKLVDLQWYGGVYHTRRGPVRVQWLKRHCKRYCVHGDERIYDAGVPSILHVELHTFVETALAEIWDDYNSVSQVSRQDQRRHYLQEFKWRLSRPTSDGFSLALGEETIWDAFFLLALLRDWAARQLLLTVPSGGQHRFRFDDALRDRTARLSAEGSIYQFHTCDGCLITLSILVWDLQDDGCSGPSSSSDNRSWWGHWLKDDNGRPLDGRCLTADEAKKYHVVHKIGDGVTVTRNRCAFIFMDESVCQNELESVKHRYCLEHKDQNAKCVVRGCRNTAPKGKSTCELKIHRDLEDIRDRDGAGLRRRLLFRQQFRADPSTITDENGIPYSYVDEIDQTQALEDPTGYDDSLPRPEPKDGKPRAMWGRARTGAEFLLIFPCGIILRRDTMMRGEGVSAVREILLRAFPTNESMPGYFFYDSNCIMSKHLHNEGYMGENAKDTPLRDICLPVDPFHFNCKHKVTDAYCRENCDPAAFTPLYDANGEWRFNASICEITNAWFGGFHAICREMRSARYEFYLDEMVLMHNQRKMKQIERQGARPIFYDFSLDKAL